MHFYEQIFAWSHMDPEKHAIIFNNDALTFSDLAKYVVAAQSKLAAAGIEKQDAVALAVGNPLYRVPALLALMGMGITTINCTIQTALNAASLGAGVFITDQRLNLPASCRQVLVNNRWFEDETAQHSATPQPPSFGEEQAATVWYSSGSTGHPRPLASTWGSMVRLIANRQWQIQCARYERAAIVPSMATYFGCSEALSFLSVGSGIVFIHDEAAIIQLAELLAFDHLVMSAAQMKVIVDIARANSYQFHLLRGAHFGGGQAAPALLRDAIVLINRDLMVFYGATESGPVAAIKCARILDDVTCVGFIAPWANIRIVDYALNDVEPEVEGEILIATDSLSIPYRGQGALYRQSPAIEVRPGDRGLIDSKGALHVTGRTSDVINLGGEKIAPERIESTLCTHEQIKDAAAVGIMSDTSGITALNLFVVQTGDLSRDSLLSWWQRNGLQLPIERIEFVETIPRTESGKIARRELSRGISN